MKILVADKLSDTASKELTALGAEVISKPDLSADELPAAIGDAEIVIVRSTKVTKATIDAATALKVIIRAGAGVNTIDCAAAKAKGVFVSNTPGKNTDAVAELAIGMMIAADRRIVNATADMRNGVWNKKEYGKARGLKGRTLGVMGMGAIGKAVASRAKGMEMNIVAWDIDLTPEKAASLGVGHCATKLDLAAKSDVVTVHIAAVPATAHFFNKEFFAAMKKGAIFINCARGEVVDTAALKAAIKEKGLRVGLDLYENEPAAQDKIFADKELASMVMGATPHVGASTDQASEAVAEEVINIVKAYKATGKPLHAVK